MSRSAKVHLSAEEILERVRALGPVIEEDADEMERIQALTERVREGLVDAGAFRIGFPAQWGGPEMRLEQQTEMLESIAYHDASAGWNVTILADAGMVASLVPEVVARELYPSMDRPTSMTMHPIGRADRTPTGFRLSGTWAFGTGIRNCACAVAGFHEYSDGEPVRDQTGGIVTWMGWVPREQITTHDTWHTTGLRGSGSTGWSVDGYEVPERHMFLFEDLWEGHHEHRLVRYYPIFICNQVGVSLGIARRALDDVREYLVEQAAASHQGGALKQRVTVQLQLAEAFGKYEAARRLAMSAYSEISDVLWSDQPLSPQQEALLTTVPITATKLCYEVVDSVLDIVGSTAVLASKPYERLFRDMATAVRHRYFRREHLGLAGRLLLDEPIDSSLAG